ncbi:hypothetical protein BDV95DRAFT_332192 [Massariosphaeria phaeospora]|uniref:Secreted protein n=1 Tax=Massariosphaeria phaeospora TaxID=100035 RepID=A0A7C8IEP3_9PLEO|nr:hypothetical protein BDV95DRAFT_332192 [Massariosphaeria phaeospora]
MYGFLFHLSMFFLSPLLLAHEKACVHDQTRFSVDESFLSFLIEKSRALGYGNWVRISGRMDYLGSCCFYCCCYLLLACLLSFFFHDITCTCVFLALKGFSFLLRPACLHGDERGGEKDGACLILMLMRWLGTELDWHVSWLDRDRAWVRRDVHARVRCVSR